MGPIGVVDSGIGGTTAMRELLRAMPETTILYRCDARRWGDLTAERVDAQVQSLARELVERGATRLLLACNSACATSPDLEEQVGVPVARVLDAGLAALAETGVANAVALVTPLTHRLGAVPQSLTNGQTVTSVTSIPCSGLADAIEADSDQLIDRLIDEMPMPTEAEAVLLGCTHYPLIVDRLRRRFPELEVVQPRATHLVGQFLR